MQGVKGKEFNKSPTAISPKDPTDETITIGGLQGVLACDILRINLYQKSMASGLVKQSINSRSGICSH